MSASTSKVVNDQQKACQFLLTALHNLGPRISDLLQEQIQPHLVEGDADPSAHPLQVGLARALRANMEATVAADEAMYRANAGLEALRKERKKAERRVGREIILVRKALEVQYSAPELNQLGVGTRTAVAPGFLLRQADRIAAIFAGEEFEALLGEPIRADQVPPREATVALAAAAETLRALVQEVNAMVRVRDEAYVAKRHHLAEHNRLYVYTARTFEAVCRLAGERALAERVRRSTPRRRAEALDEAQGPEAPTEPTEAEEQPSAPIQVVGTPVVN